jgi:hypothetical protein
MILRRCYKATVNESETITEHNGFVRFAAAAKPANSGLGRRFPAVPHIERS